MQQIRNKIEHKTLLKIIAFIKKFAVERHRSELMLVLKHCYNEYAVILRYTDQITLHHVTSDLR